MPGKRKSTSRRHSRRRSSKPSKFSAGAWVPQLQFSLPDIGLREQPLVRSGMKAMKEVARPIASLLNQTPVLLATCLSFFVVMAASRMGWLAGGSGVVAGALTPSPRIIGGNVAEKGEYPHAVSIQHYRDGHTCGGSLIKEDLVLTAGHCVLRMKQYPWEYRIATGLHNLKVREKGSQVFEVVEIINHPEHTLVGMIKGNNNDVALVRIYGKSPQQVLTLDGEGQLNPDDECVATGWGATTVIPFKPSDVLKQLPMKIVSMEDCKKAYAMLRITVDSKNICALPRNEKTWEASVYFGDSGGSLLRKKDGKYVGVGVVSMGFPLVKFNGGFPTRFVKVAKVYDWLQQEMNREPGELKPLRPGWGYVIGRALAVPLQLTAMVYAMLALSTPFLVLGALVLNKVYGNYVEVRANEWVAPVGILTVLLLFMFPTLTIVFYFYLIINGRRQQQAQPEVQAQQQE